MKSICGSRDETGVTVIDTATLKVAKHIATGAGHHDIAFGADNKFAFVTNRDDGTLSIIDVAELKKLKDVKTGKRASSLAFSPLSKALYVTNEVDGSIAVVDCRKSRAAREHRDETRNQDCALRTRRPLGICA